MNDLRELLDSLEKTKHLLNEYCYGTGGCSNCPLYDSEVDKYGKAKPCCCQSTVAIGELEYEIVKILNKEKKDETQD